MKDELQQQVDSFTLWDQKMYERTKAFQNLRRGSRCELFWKLENPFEKKSILLNLPCFS